MAQQIKNPPAKATRRQGFNLWVGKVHWRRKWHPTPVFLPREFHGQRSLAGYSPRGSPKVKHDWATSSLTCGWFFLVLVIFLKSLMEKKSLHRSNSITQNYLKTLLFFRITDKKWKILQAYIPMTKN